MKQQRFPQGWDENRVKRVVEHYDSQTEREAVAEDEAAWEHPAHTFVDVPIHLVPEVLEMIAHDPELIIPGKSTNGAEFIPCAIISAS